MMGVGVGETEEKQFSELEIYPSKCGVYLWLAVAGVYP